MQQCEKEHLERSQAYVERPTGKLQETRVMANGFILQSQALGEPPVNTPGSSDDWAGPPPPPRSSSKAKPLPKLSPAQPHLKAPLPPPPAPPPQAMPGMQMMYPQYPHHPMAMMGPSPFAAPQWGGIPPIGIMSPHMMMQAMAAWHGQGIQQFMPHASQSVNIMLM